MPRFTLDGLGDADRRSVLKFLGAGGAAAAGTGLGVLSLTGSAAAAAVNIESMNPDTLVSDAGEVDSVFIEPSLLISWDGFDDVVGKVRILVEATVGDADLNPNEIGNLEYTPVFRATAYANDTDNDVETETGPGTSGEFELDWFAGDKSIVLYDEDGGPDYANAAYNCGATMETYLNGSLMGDPIEGAENGFYGPAGTTAPFEVESDGGETTTTVYLRYTITLHKPDISFVEEDNYDLDAEDVRPFSPLVMAAGEGGQYPDLSDPSWGTEVTSAEAGDYDDLEAGEVVPATAIPYSVLQDNTEHPAIMSEYTSFSVTVENQEADAGVTGESNPGVSVEENIGTMTPTNETGE